jgi:hypothetical protein
MKLSSLPFMNNLGRMADKGQSPFVGTVKIIFLTGILCCAIIIGLFYGNLGIYGYAYINNAFATTVGNDTLNQLPTSQQQVSEPLQPNIDAKSIFDTKTAVLGNNVKTLIILIPNEAHHGNGEPKEARFIEQSFLPQRVVVNRGTQMIWFSGDVGHEHRINLNGGSSSFSPNPYESGEFADNSASTPVVFNSVGKYEYNSPNVSPEAERNGFVMKGEIDVVDQPNELSISPIAIQSPSSSSSPPSAGDASPNLSTDTETIGVYMVPTKEVDTYLSQFEEKGLSVDSTYSFKDVRGLARGTNSEQTLVVWSAPPNLKLDNVLGALKEITPTLPYK